MSEITEWVRRNSGNDEVIARTFGDEHKGCSLVCIRMFFDAPEYINRIEKSIARGE